MLIDFEKAFDSLSWNFIFECLNFFNFGKSIQQWIEVFYKNISSCIIQNGIVSEYFKPGRGCRQGDPISPYLFIICAEILGILIRNNRDIKGIKINGEEYKISQMQMTRHYSQMALHSLLMEFFKLQISLHVSQD